MKKLFALPLFLILGSTVAVGAARAEEASDIDLSEWKLVWEDDFDYPDRVLDRHWVSQNGPSGHILSSRWRENVVVKDGVLHLVNRKERRGGQEWTSGNIWTKRKFQYGYFECRYRYAEVNATNNSFWLMTQEREPKRGKRFEIDINEGHFPNEVNTNVHNWSDITVLPNGKKTHPSDSQSFTYGTRPDYSYQLEIPVRTRRIRLTSDHERHFHLREFRAFSVNRGKYPAPLSEAADRDIEGLVNHMQAPGLQMQSSGRFNRDTRHESVADGNVRTSWITQTDGEKWIEFKWPREVEVGCVQFVNGWQQSGSGDWVGMASDFKVQYHDGAAWVDIASLDVASSASNFGAQYNTYGLEWSKEELIFYLNGKEIRREPNTIAFSPTPILLSLAIIKWDGPVTDAIDGTSMKVDWVRYYRRKRPAAD